MCRKRLDSRDRLPHGMEEYLSVNGWHFSKKMCEWAVSRMYGDENSDDSSRKAMMSHEDLMEICRLNGVTLKDVIGYDAVYVYCMAKMDYVHSITDDQHRCLFVKDFLEDADGYDEVAFTRFYADCIGKGEIIPWEDVL